MGLVPGSENENNFTLPESAISAVLQNREEARRSKDFTTADRLREELKAKVCACWSFFWPVSVSSAMISYLLSFFGDRA